MNKRQKNKLNKNKLNMRLDSFVYEMKQYGFTVIWLDGFKNHWNNLNYFKIKEIPYTLFATNLWEYDKYDTGVVFVGSEDSMRWKRSINIKETHFMDFINKLEELKYSFEDAYKTINIYKMERLDYDSKAQRQIFDYFQNLVNTDDKIKAIGIYNEFKYNPHVSQYRVLIQINNKYLNEDTYWEYYEAGHSLLNPKITLTKGRYSFRLIGCSNYKDFKKIKFDFIFKKENK